MEIALWLCLIPITWAAIAHFTFKRTITWKEGLLQGGGIALVVLLIYGCMAYSNTADHEILNGQVTGKKQTWTSCSHSYSCNCYTTCSGTGASRSCTRHCSTCYEHSNDWDWDVFTTVGNIEIDRVDRRGSREPPRWSAVQIGEHAAVTHTYTNYVKAAPSSLFNVKLAESEAKSNAAIIPQYPRIYDYYRVDHTIDIQAGVANRKAWDAELDEVLKTMGAARQVNVVLVFVGKQGREYKDTLERAWLGGKKNDVVIVVGVTGTKIDWVEAFTFGKTSGNGMLAVKMRDELQKYGTTENAKEGVAVITKVIASDFHRKNMKDYEYLKAEGGPSATQIGWLVGIVLVLLMVTTFLLHKYDVFNEEFYDRHPNIRYIRNSFRR
ncbi:hypothetical protein [Xanthomonas phage BUDD]|nr:hypothetical protein [Xanthomonas phage BUDD]